MPGKRTASKKMTQRQADAKSPLAATPRSDSRQLRGSTNTNKAPAQSCEKKLVRGRGGAANASTDESVTESRMDVHERRVITRKKGLIAEVLGFKVLDQSKYRDVGLLDDDMLAAIVVDPSECGQVVIWLNLLCQHAKKDTFSILQRLLEDSGYGWIADELRIDLMAEKGELEIEEYVLREAGSVVHRHFGQSKRISERDKKDMQDILALRYQAAKLAWHSHYLACKEKLKDVEIHEKHESSQIKIIADKVRAFLRVQKRQFSRYSRAIPLDVSSPTDEAEGNAENYFKILEKYLDSFLEVFSRVLLQTEKLEDERKRCLSMLKFQKPIVHLDMAFEEALKEMAEELSRYEREAVVTDRTLKSLDATVKDLHSRSSQELTTKEKHLAHLDAVVRQRDARIQQLEALYEEAKGTKEETEDEVTKWKNRCEMLEKTRRLGYLNPRWSEKFPFPDDLNSPKDRDMLPSLQKHERAKPHLVKTDSELGRQSNNVGSSNNHLTGSREKKGQHQGHPDMKRNAKKKALITCNTPLDAK